MAYADKLLNRIDPQKKFIKYRLFRDSCVEVFGSYLKDLTVLKRDLSKICIIDNSPQAYGFQIDNGIPIENFIDNPNDCEFRKLIPFLEELSKCNDVRPLIRNTFKTYM